MDDAKSDETPAIEDEPQPMTHPDGSPIYSAGARRGDFVRRRRWRPLPSPKR